MHRRKSESREATPWEVTEFVEMVRNERPTPRSRPAVSPPSPKRVRYLSPSPYWPDEEEMTPSASESVATSARSTTSKSRSPDQWKTMYPNLYRQSLTPRSPLDEAALALLMEEAAERAAETEEAAQRMAAAAAEEMANYDAPDFGDDGLAGSPGMDEEAAAMIRQQAAELMVALDALQTPAFVQEDEDRSRATRNIVFAIRDKNAAMLTDLLARPFDDETDDGMSVLQTCIHKNWPEGVKIILDMHPTMVRDDRNNMVRGTPLEMAYVFSTDSLKTLIKVLQGQGLPSVLLLVGRNGIYRLSPDKMGQGAYGSVLKAELLVNNTPVKTVAVKTFDSTRYFEEEKRNAAALNCSPNFLCAYDEMRVGPYHAIAYELAKGDLISFVKWYPKRTEKQIFDFVHFCMDALSFLIHNKLVHRDIKPGNILYYTEDKPFRIRWSIGDLGSLCSLPDAPPRFSGMKKCIERTKNRTTVEYLPPAIKDLVASRNDYVDQVNQIWADISGIMYSIKYMIVLGNRDDMMKPLPENIPLSSNRTHPMYHVLPKAVVHAAVNNILGATNFNQAYMLLHQFDNAMREALPKTGQ